MVDEICTALPLDPIEFRRRNALATAGRTLAGNTYSVSIRTPEVLDKLEQHPIWKEQAEQKTRGQQAGVLVGTGVACATKNYGTGGDCSLGRVEIGPNGRITISCDGVEIGNGIGTAAANRVAAHLGAVADEVALARVDAFGPLGLVTSGDPYTMNQKLQDAAARNPRWVPAISSATGASTGAHVGTHPAAEAARVVFRFGLWPAAMRRGAGKFVRIDRSNVKFPPTNLNRSGPTYTALCGAVVRIEIDRGTGALRIAKAYSVLECGQALVPEVVLGQAHGGFAMGVGYALLESLPFYEDGPGNGKWNLGQYRVARGSDLPLQGLEVEMLPTR